MTGIRVFVGGQEYTDIACRTLTFSKRFEVGDAIANWSMPFPKYVIPGDYALTSLIDGDSGDEFWRGRFRWQLKGWDGCNGMASCSPEGLATSLTDEVFHESVSYGPQIKKKAAPPDFPTAQLIGTVISLTMGGAVQHAVGELCPSVSVGAVGGTAILLEERTRDFFHSDALEVIKYMSGLSVYFSTPFVPKVHNGIFTWTTTPGGVRYTVTLGDGVEMDVDRKPENIANRVGVGYARNQGVVSPAGAVSYGEIPIIRDKAINMSGQITQAGIAQQVADGVLARGAELRNGWGYRVTIKRVARVYDNARGSLIPAWLMEPGEWLQINSIDNGSFSTHPPSTHFITEVTCNNNLTVALTCGETRTQQDAAAKRWQIAQSEPIKDAVSTTTVPSTTAETSKLTWSGPKIADNTDQRVSHGPIPQTQEPPHPANPPGDPRGVDFPYSTMMKVLPQLLPGNQPAISLKMFGVDLKVASTIVGDVNFSPFILLGWEINCKTSQTFTLRCFSKSTTGQIGPDMALTGGTPHTVGGATFYSSDYRALASQLWVPYFDRLIVVVSTAAGGGMDDDDWASLHLCIARAYPGYPDVARDPDDASDYIITDFTGNGKNAA